MTIPTAAYVVERTATMTAQREAEEARRGELLRQAQVLVARQESAGWSDDVWDLCRNAAAIRGGDDVRDLAAASLVGLDARPRKRFAGTRATSLAFDPKGHRLLMNTVTGRRDPESETGNPLPGSALLWDLTTGEERQLDFAGQGPVAFADGEPRQLIVAEDQTSVAWIDLVTRREVLRLTIPLELLPGRVVSTCSTPDCSTVAAVLVQQEQQTSVLIWDGRSGQLLKQQLLETEIFALSPDGSLLATTGKNGDITVRSLRDETQLSRLRGSGREIQKLSFGRDPRQFATPEADGGPRMVVGFWIFGWHGDHLGCRAGGSHVVLPGRLVLRIESGVLT